MRILVCSDIHGNVSALRALLRLAYGPQSQYRAERVICLGDVIGYYGTKPAHALELIWSVDPHFRIGNHELAVAGVHYDGLGPRALMAAYRHRKHLINTPQWDRLLREAQQAVRQDTLVEHYAATPPHSKAFTAHFAHSTPAADTPLGKATGPYDRPVYHPGPNDLQWSDLQVYYRKLNPTEVPLFFVGHSHVGMLIDFKGGIMRFRGARYGEALPIFENNPDFVLINPGSVGQPRDTVQINAECPQKQAHGVILDTERQELTFIAAGYDLDLVNVEDELELNTFTQGMPDEMVRELYRLLHNRPPLGADQLTEIRTQLDGLWKEQAEFLFNMLTAEDVPDSSDWAYRYSCEGFTVVPPRSG